MRRSAPIVLAVLLAGCAGAPSRSARSLIDQGYLQGSADAVKRLYWAKQALEAPRPGQPAGRTEYYTWQDGGTAQGAGALAQAQIAVPVFIPAPAPSGAQGP